MAVRPARAPWLAASSSTPALHVRPRPVRVGPAAGALPGSSVPRSPATLGSTVRMSQSLAARIVAVGGIAKPDHARSTPRMFASARDDAVRARLVRANRRAAWTRRRAPTIVTAALPRDDDGERREISRRGPDGSRAGGYPNPAPGTLRKKQIAKDVTRDGVAATAVMYAFAAWQWLQWPAVAPHPSLVPAPFHAALVAAAATGLITPALAAAAHPGANYGVK